MVPARARLPLLLPILPFVVNVSMPVIASADPALASLAAFTVNEATAGDLNGDGDALDAVVHVMEPRSGVRNLGLAVHQTCDTAPPVPHCSPAQPVVGDTAVAFVVSEAAQGATDFTADGDAVDDVVFVYDARRHAVLSTSLAVAHGVTRSVSFIRFAIAPVVVADAVVFLVSESEHGRTDLNGDGDAADAVVHVLAAHSHRIIGAGIAAPRIGTFGSPVLDAVGDGKLVTLLVGEPEQGADLDGDGGTDDVVAMEIHVQSGITRLAR